MENALVLGDKTPIETFQITFSFDGDTKTLRLKNGQDVFKLYDVYMKLLEDNDIEYTERSSTLLR